MNSVTKVFEVSGTLGGEKARQVRREINEIVKEGINTIVIDLKNVSFMDSSGLAALVLIQRNIQASGGKLFLASISESVKMLLELTSTENVFEILTEPAAFKENAKVLL